jgi:hypothetical protein
MDKNKNQPSQTNNQQQPNPDDVLRRLLAMPPQPKKAKADKDKPATK